MTLAVLVFVGTVIAWLVILVLRWAAVRPVTPELSQRSMFAAAELSAAVVGAAYPTLWAVSSNLGAWMATGRAGFVFAGHLPPGVDEDDLLIVLIVGVAILVARACGRYFGYLIQNDPLD